MKSWLKSLTWNHSHLLRGECTSQGELKVVDDTIEE